MFSAEGKSSFLLSISDTSEQWSPKVMGRKYGVLTTWQKKSGWGVESIMKRANYQFTAELPHPLRFKSKKGANASGTDKLVNILVNFWLEFPKSDLTIYHPSGISEIFCQMVSTHDECVGGRKRKDGNKGWPPPSKKRFPNLLPPA